MNDPLITQQTLDDFGISLTDAQDATALLAHLNETLDERVGAEITETLDDEQLKELLALQEKSDDEAVGTWLSANVDELEQITQDEIDILLGELAEISNDINAAK